MLKIRNIERNPRMKVNLKVCSFDAKFPIDAFYLAVQFQESQVIVYILLSSMC